MKKIFICAGEVSGDMHAAALMTALCHATDEPLVFRGFGGDAMRAAGAELLFHTDDTAAMGITPVLRKLPFFIAMYRRIRAEIIAWQPDVVVTVDYPGMNLKIARFARAHGIRTVHEVCPQVWAWHRGRIPAIARALDCLLCFFPFEPALFSKTPLKTVFIGHPLVDAVRTTQAEHSVALPWHQTRYRVALLPGSRAGEITRILPRMLAAAARVEEKLDDDCSFIIPAPTEAMRARVEAVLAQTPKKPAYVTVITGNARAVLAQAGAAVVASGTATLEACLLRCPTVLVYAVGWLTYAIGRIVIRGVRFIGLANIIAERSVMPELIQQAFQPDVVCNVLCAYLTDSEKRAQTICALEETNARLGGGHASERAAAAVLDVLAEPRL